jgi:hypothetical protein
MHVQLQCSIHYNSVCIHPSQFSVHCGEPGRGRRRAAEPEFHRFDPESGSTLKALIEILGQTAGSTCEFWVNPVNFTVRGGQDGDVFEHFIAPVARVRMPHGTHRPQLVQWSH